MGVVREGYPEVVTYEVEMTAKHMKKGLGRALQVKENTWAMEESTAHLESIRKFCFVEVCGT